MAKLAKYVEVLKQETHDGRLEFSGDSLNDFIEELVDIYNSIPLEYRTAAKIEIEARNHYEHDSAVKIEICYYRPETDAERIERETKKIAADLADQERERTKRRAEYLKLKAEFEPTLKTETP